MKTYTKKTAIGTYHVLIEYLDDVSLLSNIAQYGRRQAVYDVCVDGGQ